jgi:hypothetical protein
VKQEPFAFIGVHSRFKAFPERLAHRPPPEAGAGSESSVRKTRRIETEARGGGSVERMLGFRQFE